MPKFYRLSIIYISVKPQKPVPLPRPPGGGLSDIYCVLILVKIRIFSINKSLAAVTQYLPTL